MESHNPNVPVTTNQSSLTFWKKFTSTMVPWSAAAGPQSQNIPMVHLEFSPLGEYPNGKFIVFLLWNWAPKCGLNGKNDADDGDDDDLLELGASHFHAKPFDIPDPSDPSLWNRLRIVQVPNIHGWGLVSGETTGVTCLMLVDILKVDDDIPSQTSRNQVVQH